MRRLAERQDFDPKFDPKDAGSTPCVPSFSFNNVRLLAFALLCYFDFHRGCGQLESWALKP